MESDLRRWMRLVEGDAWHGSPRQFAAFSTDHIGSGEGFSSFGWGLYFTDTRAVADWYRHKLAPDAGHIYQVKLPSIQNFLNWELPFSRQPEPVKTAILKMPQFRRLSGDDVDQEYLDEFLTGQHIYLILRDALGSEKAASLALRDAGVVGSMYRDGASRGGGGNSWNYVVFDGKMVSTSKVETHADQPPSEHSGSPERS